MIDNGMNHGSTSLGEYAAILWRRKAMVLAAIIGVPIVAFAFLSTQRAEYTASADVLLRTENLAATLSGVPDPSFGQDPQRLLDTQAKLARTPPVARSAVGLADSNVSAEEFLESSSVTVDPSADILTFSASAPTPDAAIRRVNAYAQAYTRYRAELDLGPVRQALATVNARLRELRDADSTGVDLYSTLLERQQELESIRALRSQSAVVVDPALEAPQTKPRVVFGVMLGLIVGILLGVAVALIREAVEKRPRSTDELERRLGLHLLGRIPASQAGKTSLVTLSQPSSVDAEAYRLLRMNFEFIVGQVGGRIFAVTSTTAEEGKSTVAANLAVALARVGRSVILVDCDPLRPVLRSRFRIRTSASGLNEVLNGHATLDRALVEFALPAISDEFPGVTNGAEGELSVEPGGDPRDENKPVVKVIRQWGEVRDLALSPSRPAEVVDGGSLRILVSDPTPVEMSDYLVATKLEGLFAQLRREAEIVIVDSPPLATSVGTGVGRLADGLVVVANLPMMRRPLLEKLDAMLEGLATPKLGLVLTGLSADETATYGYHYAQPKQQPEALTALPPSTEAAQVEGRWRSTS